MENLQEAADILADTGAIVHTIAVGDSVECDTFETGDYNDYYYYDSNNETYTSGLGSIPRNGGRCTSVPEPHTLTHIIDDLIGTELVNLELKVDSGSYTDISSRSDPPLPQNGSISVSFDTEVDGLSLGEHMVCVRATGLDSMNGTATVEDCHMITIVPKDTSAPTPDQSTDSGFNRPAAATPAFPNNSNSTSGKEKGIIAAVAALVGMVLISGIISVVRRGKKETSATSTPQDLNLDVVQNAKDVEASSTPALVV